MWRLVLPVILGVVCSTRSFADDVLYKQDGKKYKTADLSPAGQQNLHEIDMQRYRQIKAAVEAEVLDAYFEDLAKKQKKTKEEVEVAELKVKTPTEAELKKFYEENKDKIPPGYTFEQVKGEIGRVLAGQETNAQREKLLEKVKKAKGFEFALAEPEAPLIDINTKGFPTTGKPGSKVKIVEFADFQCPHCRKASESLKKLVGKYGEKVEFVYIDFPINRSGISRTVAEGAYCALKQGKYWEYHEMAFAKQAALSKDSPQEFAKALKLNDKDFQQCLGSAEAKTFVSNGKNEGERVGVGGTPTIFINGRKYTANHEYDAFKAAVDKLL